MLHAFKLGKLEIPNDSNADTCVFGTNDKACLSNPTGYLGGSSVPLGHEMWAFIPKNVLPYLRYILDPDYCHVYSVDFTPYIFDASINIDERLLQARLRRVRLNNSIQITGSA